MLAMTIGRFFQLIGSPALMIERFTFPVMHSTQNFIAAPSPPSEQSGKKKLLLALGRRSVLDREVVFC